MRQIETTTLTIDAPVVVAHRKVPVSRSIVNCTVLQGPAVCAHQPRIVGRVRVVRRTPRIVNRARPVIHPVNQRGRMAPALEPALFDDQERFVPPLESWATEQASLFDESGPISPSLPDFLGRPDILELFPGTTIGALEVLRARCIVGPVFVVQPPKADWPLRVSWSLLLPALDMVCRSASRDPRTAERLKQAVIAILAARSQESADGIAQKLRCSEYRSPVFQRLVNRLAQWPTEHRVASQR